jgi:hypothetical protein
MIVRYLVFKDKSWFHKIIQVEIMIMELRGKCIQEVKATIWRQWLVILLIRSVLVSLSLMLIVCR